MQSPITWPAGVQVTNCLARSMVKFLTLEQPQRVRAVEEQLRHVVRLVQQRGCLRPGSLLVAPVGEGRRNERRGFACPGPAEVRCGRVVVEVLDETGQPVDQLLKRLFVTFGHGRIMILSGNVRQECDTLLPWSCG
jgi:hypothetical protein